MMAINNIIQKEGVKALYRGYGATLGSFGTFSAIYFLIYENLKCIPHISSFSEIMSRSNHPLVHGEHSEFPRSLPNCNINIIEFRLHSSQIL